MKRIAAVVSVSLLVAGCQGMSDGWNATRSCQRELGAKPYAGADMFGLAGALVADQNQDVHTYNERMAACMLREMASKN